VFSKRTGCDDKSSRSGDQTVEMETLRSSAIPHDPSYRRSDEERMSLFWRVFGGTILSVAALVAITVFNNLNSNISELRNEVSRLNEAKAEAAKKDDLNALRTQVATHADFRREIDSLKERATKHRGEIDEAKKELGGQLDGVKKEMAGVELLKERLAASTAELKTAKDEIQKLRMEMDKNQAYDFERRDRRDVQMKSLDETIKEMQKNLLEAREKIARLEGQQGPGKAGATGEVGAPKAGSSAPAKPKMNISPRRTTSDGEGK
jgi:myosin heavy subunit